MKTELTVIRLKTFNAKNPIRVHFKITLNKFADAWSDWKSSVFGNVAGDVVPQCMNPYYIELEDFIAIHFEHKIITHKALNNNWSFRRV